MTPEDCQHDYVPDKMGEMCSKCGDRPNPSRSFSPRRREVVPEPKELKRAEGRENMDLSNTNSDTIVVPATLAMVQDVEVVIGMELRALRLKAEKNITMDVREASRMKMLVGMLKEATELREKAEKGGQPELQKMSLTDIIKKLKG